MPALRRKLILDYTRRKLDSPMLGRGFESLRLHLMIKTLLAAARRVFYSDKSPKGSAATFKVICLNIKPPMREQRYGFDSLHGPEIEVRGRRSEIRGQRSEVRDQRSD